IAQRTITGMITDADGETLIGANVLAKGTSVGTITDIDGSFSLEVPDGTQTLVVSYTGYDSQEIDISASSHVAIVMSEGQLLDEIVVTAGGLERNKARLGYAIQNVDADDIVSSKEVNLVNALSSKVAGVSVVSSSGSPGASANIRIRGNTSVNGTNSPLFVVDGVPINNGSVGNATDGVDQSNRVIDLNPNDIQSMTVLKGPSASALYGVRAANGAIIITTKRGSSGKPRVSVSTSYSLDQVNKLPARQSTFAQGRVLGGVPTYMGPETGNGFSWGPKISDLEFDGAEDYPFNKNGALVAKGTGNGVAAKTYDPYTFFIDGNSVDLNASVAGGTDALSYFISAGRLSSNGIVPNSTFARNSFRVNLDSELSSKIKVGMSANYSASGGNRIQRGSNLNGVMLGLMRSSSTFDNGNGLSGQAAADEESTYVQENGDQRSYRNGIYDNPYWTVNRNPFVDDVNRMIGNAFVNYSITDDLVFTSKVGVDQYSDARNGGFDIQTNSFRQVAGSVFQRKVNNRDINTDFTLGYNKYLSDNFSLNALIGYNIFDSNYNSQSATGTTLAVPGFFDISNATDVVAGNATLRKRLYGAYATADIGLNDYLFANLTVRNDWSSILPEANNQFQSYSTSLGFVLTEALNINNDIFDYAKLRVGYGKVGNDGGSAFISATQNVFTQAGIGGDGFITTVSFPNFGFNAFERSTLLGNAALKPEATKTFEVGGEFKFLRGRLNADITYYNSRSEDVIIATQISAATGFANVVQNSGVITNEGIELVVDGRPIQTDNFAWDIGINFSQSENLVESLADGVEDIFLAGFVSTSVDVVPGKPFSSIYGTGWQRTDNGQVIVGSDGWPLTDPIKKALGDPNPDWTMGIRNSFSYKGITLSGLLDIRQGGDMWCGTCGIINYFGTSELSADERDDVVVFDGVMNTGSADEPIYVENTTAVALGHADETASFSDYYRVRYGFGGISEMNIFDTSWLRLRELTLAYQLPESVIGGVFEGATISLTGRNLWLSTDYPGIDPETNLTGDSNGYGLDYFNMPNTKSYTATVKLNF
ncbi:MAG: SusC/RagA family TonB-linked outer membrane protein, partial [Saprospiraceae bacterium]